jgi:hypothetical protein
MGQLKTSNLHETNSNGKDGFNADNNRDNVDEEKVNPTITRLPSTQNLSPVYGAPGSGVSLLEGNLVKG